MLFSTETNEIFKALAEAQGSFGIIPETGINPHFKSTYSTLKDIEITCRPHLKNHGLGYTQMVQEVGEYTYLTTILTHSSGQWMQSNIMLRPATWDAQKVGSYITYMRRYMLAGLLGVASCEDDDGNNESVNRKPSTPTIDQDTVSRIFEVYNQLGKDARVFRTLQEVCKAKGIKEIAAVHTDLVHQTLDIMLKEWS